jgi:ribosomal protein L37E
MRKCKKCEGEFPKHIWVDGKKRNLQNRKFCLACSPFGEHNTRDLVGKNGNYKFHTECDQCSRQFNTPQKKRAKCSSCYFNNKLNIRKEKVQEITGCKCWFCGYGKTWRNLAFHHVDPEEKKFGLSTRELVGYSWVNVFKEMQKCVLCCHNCHGEIHEGLILEEKVLEKHKFWEQNNTEL